MLTYAQFLEVVEAPEPAPTVMKFGVRIFDGEEVLFETGGIFASMDSAFAAAASVDDSFVYHVRTRA